MKKLFIAFALIISVFALSSCTETEETSEQTSTTEEASNVDLALDASLESIGKDKKVYVTTIGQGPEFEIVYTMLTSATSGVGLDEADVTKDKALTADQVDADSVVIIVPGASSKGLTGQFDKDSEEARANEFATRAANDEITLIMIHNGGEGRRGDLSDTMIENSSKDAEVMLVLESGNMDGFFDTLSSDHNVPVYYFSSNVKFVPALKQIFE